MWLIAIIAVGVGLALLAWGLYGDRARGRRRCPKCWYDMAATPSSQCSECGFDAGARGERAFVRTRRQPRWAAAGAMLAAAGIALPVADWSYGRRWRAVPRPLVLLAAPWVTLEPDRGLGNADLERSYHRVLVDITQNRLPEWEQRLLARRLSRCLGSRDERQQQMAAIFIAGAARRGNDMEACIPALVRTIEDASPGPALSAAGALASIAPARAGQTELWCSFLLHSPVEPVRSLAARVLGDAVVGVDGGVAFEALVLTLHDESDEIAAWAARSLARSESPNAVAPLVRMLSRNEPRRFSAAIDALGALGPVAAPAGPLLLEALVHRAGEVGVARDAVSALGRIGPPAVDAVPAIVEAMRDLTTQTAAVWALGRIGDSRAEVMTSLLEQIGNRQEFDTSHRLRVLCRLGYVPDSQNMVVMEQLAGSNHRGVARWAQVLLARGRGEHQEVIGLLIDALSDRDAADVEVAASSLRQLGSLAAPALPALRRRLSAIEQRDLYMKSAFDAVQEAIGDIEEALHESRGK